VHQVLFGRQLNTQLSVLFVIVIGQYKAKIENEQQKSDTLSVTIYILDFYTKQKQTD